MGEDRRGKDLYICANSGNAESGRNVRLEGEGEICRISPPEAKEVCFRAPQGNAPNPNPCN
jgi:hypothetical protein